MWTISKLFFDIYSCKNYLIIPKNATIVQLLTFITLKLNLLNYIFKKDSNIFTNKYYIIIIWYHINIKYYHIISYINDKNIISISYKYGNVIEFFACIASIKYLYLQLIYL